MWKYLFSHHRIDENANNKHTQNLYTHHRIDEILEASFGGQMQRRNATPIADLRRGPVRQEPLRRLPVVVVVVAQGGGGDEGGGPVEGLGVHVCAVRHEHLHLPNTCNARHAKEVRERHTLLLYKT